MRALRHIGLLVNLLLSCAMAHAQTGLPVYDRLVEQREVFPLERVYVHTDAEDYLQGDRIWLKAYLMDEVDHTPVDSTLYLYVELFDKDGKQARQVKLLRRQGAFYGYLDIPEDLPSGEAWIRAYSRYMASAPETAFVKRITVGRGKRPLETVSPSDRALDLVRRPHGFQLKYDGKEPCYLIVLRGGEICFLGGTARNRISLPDDVLPDGPLEFLVVDRNGNLVARRESTLDRGAERFRLPVSVDRREYKTGDPVSLKVDASDLHEGEMLDLSVSVTCRPLIIRHHPASISEYVLGRPLGFGYADALKGSIRRPEEKEQTATLSGLVRTEILGRPVKDARIGLISPEVGMLDVQQSGPDGRFRFEGLDFPAGTRYLVKSTDLKGRDRYDLVVDEESFPPFVIPENPYETALDETVQVVYADDDNPFGTIALEEAAVSVTIDGPPPTGFNRLADYAITLSKIEERGYHNLLELLQEVPGVFIKHVPENGMIVPRAFIRGVVSIEYEIPAAIAVDGTILEGEYDLEVIPMPDIARVDIFKTGQTVLWGAKGGGGVISITTKAGVLDKELLHYGRTVHQRVIPLGYQPSSDFESAIGYRNRRTVYWNPQMLSDTISFPAGETPGTFLVVVEGVTSDGRLVHEETTFEVSQ